METVKAWRQGDIAGISIPKLPKGLKASKTDTLLSNGSGDNPHTFNGGSFYPHVKGDFILGYLEAKGTKIYHVEHSPKGDKVEDGVWEIRKQSEYTNEGLRPVID